jgi:SAM-dependent methyltransferase
MHLTAMENGARFFNTYCRNLEDFTVIDVGAQDVNGSLRSVMPKNGNYVGVDFTPGRGVDVVLDDPYKLPFDSGSVDFVISSSCFEHSEMFWLLYLEILRILKPDGLFYLNAPSAGGFHRYPVDCYRFFPDSGVALCKWAKYNGYDAAVLEHYTHFSDYVCVTIKDEKFVQKYPGRIIFAHEKFTYAAKYPDYKSLLIPVLGSSDPWQYSPHLKLED